MTKIELPRISLSGRYKLEVRRHGELIHDTGWFDNLITDAGLNAMGKALKISAYVMVGTSNVTPLVTDTTLIAQVASKNNDSAPYASYSSGVNTSGTRYGWARVTCPFAQGAVTGNIAEVGIGWDATQVFSRSLVNPAISIIEIDQLTVVYELRMYLPTVDVTGSVNIGLGSYNYTIRPMHAANAGYAGDATYGWAPKLLLLGATARAWVQFSPGVFYGSVAYGPPAVLQTNVEATAVRTTDGGGTTSPVGSAGASSTTNASYGEGSNRCEFTVGWATSGGNIAGFEGWTAINAGSNAHNGVTYGGGSFVAVGDAGEIRSSVDGSDWVARTSGTANALNAVAYGSGKFVAVGAAGTILTSSDGATWVSRTSGTANALHGVTYGGSQFVAVGASGTVLTSPDAVTWTTQTSGTASTLYAVAYGSSKFAVAGASGVIITSSDAVTWTARTSGTSGDLRFVGFGLGLFLAGGPSNFITRSSDGLTWTTGTIGAAVTFRGIAFSATHAFIVGGALYRSTDGTTWTQTGNPGYSHHSVAYGESVFVSVTSSAVIHIIGTGGIKAFAYTGLFGSYQCVLDGVIAKDDTKTLAMTWEQTWARRP